MRLVNKFVPFVFLIGLAVVAGASGTPDYHDVITKSISSRGSDSTSSLWGMTCHGLLTLNPNMLTSPMVADDRHNFTQFELATYINVSLVGTLAFLFTHLQRKCAPLIQQRQWPRDA